MGKEGKNMEPNLRKQAGMYYRGVCAFIRQKRKSLKKELLDGEMSQDGAIDGNGNVD